MSKRAALVPVLLLAGVVAAVVGATAALRFVGGGAFGPGGQPLTPADVQRALTAQSSSAPGVQGGHNPTPAPARSPAPTTSQALDSFTGSGGSVYATCLSGQVRLASWSPAQGYKTDGYSRGPAASAWVKFKSGTSELTISVTCRGGQPRFAPSADNAGGTAGGGAGGGGGGGEVGDDHGGGGSGRGGGGGSGSGRGGG